MTDTAKRLISFTITDIQANPDRGYVAGRVDLTFRDDQFGDPVFQGVRIGAHIKHDATANLGTLEREFLRHARALLDQTLRLLDSEDPTEIRQQAASFRAAIDADDQAQFDADLASSLKTAQPD